MQKHKTTKWTYKDDKKLKGAFGQTDFKKKVISVNKKVHKQAKKLNKSQSRKKYGMAKSETTLLNTLVHETRHKNHPKELEKTVRKKSKEVVKKLGKKAKSKLYSKVARKMIKNKSIKK